MMVWRRWADDNRDHECRSTALAWAARSNATWAKRPLRYNAAMSDRFASLRQATAGAVLESHGKTNPDLRQLIAQGTAPLELRSLVEKIWSCAHSVTDQDIESLKKEYSEDQLFEIIVAAALGASQHRLAAAQRALEQA